MVSLATSQPLSEKIKQNGRLFTKMAPGLYIQSIIQYNTIYYIYILSIIKYEVRGRTELNQAINAINIKSKSPLQ